MRWTPRQDLFLHPEDLVSRTVQPTLQLRYLSPLRLFEFPALRLTEARLLALHQTLGVLVLMPLIGIHRRQDVEDITLLQEHGSITVSSECGRDSLD